jgi:predicted  nucleic acid-binding Zn-ribbon protein
VTTADLQALLVLQDLDTRIDQETHRKANLPARVQLEEILAAMAQKEQERAVLSAARDEVAARQAEAERELQATEARIAQVHSKLYSGEVTATRELQAMAADEELLRKRQSELEDKALALMEERDPLDAEVSALDAALRDLEERQREAVAALASAEAEVDALITDLARQRPGAKAAVAPPMLATYERLRQRLDGVAVARLVGGRCDGCHLSLPAMELDRIRHQSAGSLEYCEQCGRILVPVAAS